MADDDDRGSQDNTGRDHKPKNAKTPDNAPEGHLGTRRVSAPGLGTSGTSNKRQVSQAGEQTPKTEPQKHVDPAKDSRIAFAETNDPEVNAHYGKAERMIGKDDPKHPENVGEKAAGPRISQSEYAKTFRRAAQRDTALRQAPKRGLE